MVNHKATYYLQCYINTFEIFILLGSVLANLPKWYRFQKTMCRTFLQCSTTNILYFLFTFFHLWTCIPIIDLVWLQMSYLGLVNIRMLIRYQTKFYVRTWSGNSVFFQGTFLEFVSSSTEDLIVLANFEANENESRQVFLRKCWKDQDLMQIFLQ